MWVDKKILIGHFLITFLAKYCCILSTKTNDLCFYNLLTRSELISCISSSTCSGSLIKLVYFLSLFGSRTFSSHLSKHFHFLIIIRIYMSTPYLHIKLSQVKYRNIELNNIIKFLTRFNPTS